MSRFADDGHSAARGASDPEPALEDRTEPIDHEPDDRDDPEAPARAAAVRSTLLHDVGHHLGIDEAHFSGRLQRAQIDNQPG